MTEQRLAKVSTDIQPLLHSFCTRSIYFLVLNKFLNYTIQNHVSKH